MGTATRTGTEWSAVAALLSTGAALAVLAGTYWLFSGVVSALADRTLGRVAGLVMLSDDGDAEGGTPRLVAVGVVLALLASWLVARVVVAVFSRARETAADRTAARVTGSPAALASALRTLDDQMAAAPTEDLRQVSSVSSLSILPIDRGVLRDTHGDVPEPPGPIRRLDRGLFGTHPPTEDRIAALRALVGEDDAD